MCWVCDQIMTQCPNYCVINFERPLCGLGKVRIVRSARVVWQLWEELGGFDRNNSQPSEEQCEASVNVERPRHASFKPGRTAPNPPIRSACVIWAIPHSALLRLLQMWQMWPKHPGPHR